MSQPTATELHAAITARLDEMKAIAEAASTGWNPAGRDRIMTDTGSIHFYECNQTLDRDTRDFALLSRSALPALCDALQCAADDIIEAPDRTPEVPESWQIAALSAILDRIKATTNA